VRLVFGDGVQAQADVVGSGAAVGSANGELVAPGRRQGDGLQDGGAVACRRPADHVQPGRPVHHHFAAQAVATVERDGQRLVGRQLIREGVGLTRYMNDPAGGNSIHKRAQRRRRAELRKIDGEFADKVAARRAVVVTVECLAKRVDNPAGAHREAVLAESQGPGDDIQPDLIRAYKVLREADQGVYEVVGRIENAVAASLAQLVVAHGVGTGGFDHLVEAYGERANIIRGVPAGRRQPRNRIHSRRRQGPRHPAIGIGASAAQPTGVARIDRVEVVRRSHQLRGDLVARPVGVR